MTDEQLAGVVERLRAGTSTRTAEAAALQVTYNTLVSRLRKHLGRAGNAALPHVRSPTRAGLEFRLVQPLAAQPPRV